MPLHVRYTGISTVTVTESLMSMKRCNASWRFLFIGETGRARTARGLKSHVFVEKPMATMLGQKNVVCRPKGGLALIPGHILRFEAKFATVKDEAPDACLGCSGDVSDFNNPGMNLRQTYTVTMTTLTSPLRSWEEHSAISSGIRRLSAWASFKAWANFK